MDIEITPKRSKSSWFILFGLIIAIAAVYAYYTLKTPAVNRASLWISSVQYGEMELSLMTSGQLQPKTKRLITSQSTGVVSEIHIQAGETVKADSEILTLSNPALVTELRSSQSNLKIAEAELASERISIENKKADLQSNIEELLSNRKFAQKKLDAERKLFQKGIFSQFNLSQSELNFEQLQSKVKLEQNRYTSFLKTIDIQLLAKKAKIEEYQSIVTLKQELVANLNIKAGIDGIVQSIYPEIGQNLSQGEMVAVVTKPYPLQALLSVNQGAIAKIQVGMPVQISAAGEHISGRIFHIAPEVVDNMVEVKVAITGQQSQSLISQLNITATIQLSNISDTLWLPRPNKVNTGLNHFYVLDNEQKTATKRAVTIGQITAEKIEILKGLTKGEQVILSDTSDWKTEHILLNEAP